MSKCRGWMVRGARWLAVTMMAALAMVPGPASADRGEGFVSVGATGNLSFLRNPTLGYPDRLPRPNAIGTSVEASTGLGLADWLDLTLGGRLFLPVTATDEASAQGFPQGRTAYRALGVQVPIGLTARYTSGGAMTLGAAFEAGLEWTRWSLLSSTRESTTTVFGVRPRSDWSTGLFVGLHPFVGWRPFDHFSFQLGPRVTLSTTGSLQAGLGLEMIFLWGAGLF